MQKNSALVKCFLTIFFVFYTFPTNAWNALGHRIIAEIAYDHLSTASRKKINVYHAAINQVYPVNDFNDSAVWLDTIRHRGVHWFDSYHYINHNFSDDGTQTAKPGRVNVVWAIREAISILDNPRARDFDKGFALRVLLHCVGDIHQPLHAVSRVSKQFPEGDRGGYMVKLPKNEIASNLHAYWDRGAGYLLVKTKSQAREKIESIKHRTNCQPYHLEDAPERWAAESKQLGILSAYPDGQTLKNGYQFNAIQITQTRLMQAGCRLAALINTHLS